MGARFYVPRWFNLKGLLCLTAEAGLEKLAKQPHDNQNDFCPGQSLPTYRMALFDCTAQ